RSTIAWKSCGPKQMRSANCGMRSDETAAFFCGMSFAAKYSGSACEYAANGLVARAFLESTIMRSPFQLYLVAVFIALSMCAFRSTAPAADFRSGDDFVVKADETIDDDLYVCARSIRIDGTVDGDLIGWAQEITI